MISIMHPASYRMGDTSKNGDFVVRRRYESEFVIEDLYIAKRAGPFRYFHRPLSPYLNSLIRAGWSITEFREWTIDLEDYRSSFPHPPGMSPSRTDRLPMYAFFQCRKEG